MQKNKLKTEKLVAILVAIVLLAVLGVGMYQTSLTTVPSKFQTARDNNGGLNPLASYDLEAVKRSYDNFSLADADHMVKVKFLSKKTGECFIGNNEIVSYVPEEDRVDEYGKDIYSKSEHTIIDLEVQTVYWGGYQEGDIIKFLARNSYVEDAKEVILTLSNSDFAEEINRAIDSTQLNEKVHEACHGLEGMFYLDKNRVYPAFDMTYEEVYGIKGLGNPVKKYMGMKEKDFEEEMRALK